MSGLQAYHDSQNINYRDPFGAVQCAEQVKLKIEIFSDLPVAECRLRLWEAGAVEKLVPMGLLQKTQEAGRTKWVYEVRYDLPSVPGLVWYFFKFVVGQKTYFYGNNHETLGGEGLLAQSEPPGYQITVYRRSPVPAWFKQGIMYQIFVDRFYNGNDNGQVLNPKPKSLIHADWYDTPFYIKDGDGRVTRWTFFGGNLAGIIRKLPYLEELGVTIIYLNPIFEAASNHKYDTGDYLKVDPMFGDEADFVSLVHEARKRGIAVILDGVFSHTGSDSIYFNKYGRYPGLGAYQSEQSPYYKWYRLQPGQCEYDCWWGVDALPNVNELEPSYQDFIFRREDSVVRKWMDKGAKGWRLDVADELPDEFIKGLKKAIREKDPESVLIGEVWEDASRKVSHGQLRQYFWGDELDSVMNYPLRQILLGYILGRSAAAAAVKGFMSLYENYPPENFRAAMNLIGSHDRARILTLLGEAPAEDALTDLEKEQFRLAPQARERAVQRLKLLSLLQMTLPGVPCVYYGDEAGLEGYADPYNRAAFPWAAEDREILLWHKRLIAMRKEYELFASGDFRPFYYGENIVGFTVSGHDEEIRVCVNRSVTQSGTIPADYAWTGDAVALNLLEGTVLPAGGLTELQPLQAAAVYRRKKSSPQLDRASGILLHLTSLPSRWGIGDMGETAVQFIDFLAATHQKYWQILPLNPLGKGYSPYQSSSVFAGNELLISIDGLRQEGLLTEHEVQTALSALQARENDRAKVDYELVQSVKYRLLRQAFRRFDPAADVYREFRHENGFWLDDYCLYRVLQEVYDGRPWYEWEQAVALRDEDVLRGLKESYAEQMEFHQFMQYTFYRQWRNLRNYARQNGIAIIGDLPIYTAADSCDTWARPALFTLDDAGRPEAVAGVPPDYFSETGQLWEMPLYNWRTMEKDGYAWWVERVRQALTLFDYVRLDHFRGFEAYWEVSATAGTAANGRWLKGPGKRLFERLEAELGNLRFIAEDLGVITPEVNNLKNIFGFPGMKVYQFAADEKWSEDLSNTVLYSGTHDNDTLLGWYKLNRGDGLELDQQHKACLEIVSELYASHAPWVICPLQDLLLLDSEARMNTPGTVAGNWEWRLKAEDLTREVRERLADLTVRNKRAGQ